MFLTKKDLIVLVISKMRLSYINFDLSLNKKRRWSIEHDFSPKLKLVNLSTDTWKFREMVNRLFHITCLLSFLKG